MAGKRHRATARQQTKDAGGEPPAKKKYIEEGTDADYKLIGEILGFRVDFSYPVGKAFGYSPYAGIALPFIAYPVLFRQGEGVGILPSRLPGGCRGYFLGAADPGDIRTAIVEAYMKTHPNANPKSTPWKDWEPYAINRAYYGVNFFEKSGFQDLEDLKVDILQSREWGGDKHRLLSPIARIMNQKRVKTAVYLHEFFAEKLPDGIPTDATFFTKDDLSRYHERYMIKLKETAALEKKKLKKRLEDAEEDTESSGSESESDEH